MANPRYGQSWILTIPYLAISRFDLSQMLPISDVATPRFGGSQIWPAPIVLCRTLAAKSLPSRSERKDSTPSLHLDYTCGLVCSTLTLHAVVKCAQTPGNSSGARPLLKDKRSSEPEWSELLGPRPLGDAQWHALTKRLHREGRVVQQTAGRENARCETHQSVTDVAGFGIFARMRL